MTLELLPVIVEDIPAIIDIYMRAFKDKVNTTAFPRSSPHTRPWWTEVNVAAFKNEPSAHYIKIVDDGKVIAAAKWNIPTQVGEQVSGGGDDPDNMPSWPQDADVELCNEFYTTLARKRKEIMGDRPHFCKSHSREWSAVRCADSRVQSWRSSERCPSITARARLVN